MSKIFEVTLKSIYFLHSLLQGRREVETVGEKLAMILDLIQAYKVSVCIYAFVTTFKQGHTHVLYIPEIVDVLFHLNPHL